jgi:hypothetical protein
MSQDLGIVAFTNVNVIPMDNERVLENQTVIIQGERIEIIGPVNEVIVPDEAVTVAANGAYLMPGLADMHMHFVSISRTFAGPDQLHLFLAEGVTTLRNLSALPEHLEWAAEIEQGKRLGPTLYNGRMIVGLPQELQPIARRFRTGLIMAPPLLGLLIWLLWWVGSWLTGSSPQLGSLLWPVLLSLGLLLLLGIIVARSKLIPLHIYTSRIFPFASVPENAAQARRFVRRAKNAGYDFVKLYDWLSPAAYLAAAAEAGRQHIYAIGHLLDELPLPAIFEGGLREVAHVDEYMDSHMTGEASPNSGFNPVDFDYEKIPNSAAITKAHDVMVVANMVADETIYKLLEDPEGGLAQEEYGVVPPPVLQAWQSTGRLVNWRDQSVWRRDTLQPFLLAMTKALSDAGVPLLVGTDMTVEGMLPGHIHRDLELLVEAGLSPYEALQAGTQHAAISAKRMGRPGDFGTVAVGQRADLLLLEKNPLENVTHTRHRLGVMVRGRWFWQSELDMLVDKYLVNEHNG